MRPVSKGVHPTDGSGAAVVFKQYQEAAPYLKDRLGRYCSYCERRIPASLAVEHVIAKSIDQSLALIWDNFLLACANCNSHKSTKSILISESLRPDRDNTFDALLYVESGAIKPNPLAPQDSQQKAQRLLELVGLDNPSGTRDHRWDDRLEAWGKAQQAFKLLSKKRDSTMINYVVISAQASCWSIWMTVFKDDSDMQQRLVAAFPGTRWGAA